MTKINIYLQNIPDIYNNIGFTNDQQLVFIINIIILSIEKTEHFITFCYYPIFLYQLKYLILSISPHSIYP